MPYEISWRENGVIRRAYGHFTEQELCDSCHAINNDKRMASCRYVINDFSSVKSLEKCFDFKSYAQYTVISPHIKPGFLIVFVTTNPALINEIDLLISMSALEYDISVVSTLEEASHCIEKTNHD